MRCGVNTPIVKSVAPRVYDYGNYRVYLRDFYRWNKAQNPAFSLRFFAGRAGLKSYNYLKFVIDGKRRLTPTFIAPFAKALKLGSGERQYFEKLIEFTDEVSSERKQRLHEELARLRVPSGKTTLPSSMNAVYGTPEILQILELTEVDGYDGSVKWIAARMRMPQAKVREALKVLVEANLLVNKGGVLRKSHRLLDSKDEVLQETITAYHSKVLLQGARKVFEQNVDEREFGTIAFSLSDSELAALKGKIKAFREEIFRFIDQADPDPAKAVYQFGIQLFRASEKEGA